MYKLLLCWRYLVTRYLAFACIISVMLGVATLIVVNSVMSGFSTKLKGRLHGLLSDVLIEGNPIFGFPDYEGKMRKIRASALGDKIEAMTPTLEIMALLQYRHAGYPVQNLEGTIIRPVQVMGIDPEGRTRTGRFAEFLVKQKDRPIPSFALDEEAQKRWLENNPPQLEPAEPLEIPRWPGEPPPPDPPPSQIKNPEGIIVGHVLAHYREKSPQPGSRYEEVQTLRPGDEVILTTIGGAKLFPVYDRFAVCDYFKSEMSEYDSQYVFVPLAHLQKLRGMEGRATSIQIKLKDYKDAKEVVKTLQKMFPDYLVETWESKQKPLLAAIAIERGLLNVLLFLIIAVAGFGIMAIFSMIVTEKTRDIGILKALGASNAGVMKIFLGYGLLLGVVGAGLGTELGLVISENVNEIEHGLSQITGEEIFDRKVYYFDRIPTDIQATSVLWVNLGAVGIAVLFSILPALRAAMLHPVQALRYE